MSILTVRPANTDQETAIRLFLDAMHVQYNASEREIDETEYLAASPAMTEHLNKASEQEKNGQGVKVNLDDIWK